MTVRTSTRSTSASRSVAQAGKSFPYPDPRGSTSLGKTAKARPFSEALEAASAKSTTKTPTPLRTQKASELPPEKLATAKNLTEQEKVEAASRHFEAILLRQILTEAQKPVIQSKLTTNSSATDIYRDMATTQMADQISKSGSLGLSSLFKQQLTKSLPTADKTPDQAHE